MPGAGKIGLVFLLALGLLCTVGSFRAGVNAAGSENLLMEIHHPLLYRPASSSVPGSPPYVPSDIQKGYDFLPLYAQGIEGNGTSIVIIDAYGDPKLSSDLSSFDSLTSLPSPTLNTYYPNGVPSTRDSGWALETALDVEWSHAIAPAATIDLVIAPNSSVGYIFDAISYVASNLTNATVVSMSFGQSENLYPTIGPYTISATHQLFVTMVSHGTSIFASSGDSGASTCCDASYPASDPLVVAVGGTALNLDSSASYVGESVWGGSGAGSSVDFGKPSWQQGLGDSMRDIVDVSYDADPNTGVLVVQNGSHFTVGGTSAGSPQWAGLTALASQASNRRFGSIAGKLYALEASSSYHDIVTGSDGYFSATPGWDYPTGLGTPDANLFVSSFLGPSVAVRSSSLFQGLNVTTTGNLQVDNPASTVSGSLTVNAVNSTNGVQVYRKSYTLTGIKIQNRTLFEEASFLLNVPVSPYPLSMDLTLTIQNNATKVMVTVSREISVSGGNAVNIVDVTFVMSYFNSVQGTPSYNPRADLAARGSVDIIDVTLADNFFNAPVFS
jgi:subtilase family serine protease